MGRQSIWLILVVLLLGILFLREPRLQKTEELFLRWLIRNAENQKRTVSLTVVEIGGKPRTQKEKTPTDPTEKFLRGAAGGTVSPLECALLVQGLLEFNPPVVAFEPVLSWPETAGEEEQILVDQAMHVPKLLLAAELTATPDPDAPVTEISGFPIVSGKRGDLPAFFGIARQPDEDLRLISTLGFTNLPADIADDLRIPLLFQYRGEVVPSFPLQAAMMWQRVTPREVKIDIGRFVSFPDGTRIPISSDGTVVVNPNAARSVRRLSVNELALAAEQHEKQLPMAMPLDDLGQHIVLVRAADPGKSIGPVATTIAAIQSNWFIRRVSRVFDFIMLALIMAAAVFLWKIPRIELVLGAIAFTSAYCLLALGLMAQRNLWLPGFLPLGAVWILVVIAFVLKRDASQSG